MSLEDLRRMGLLREGDDAPSAHAPRSAVSLPAMLVTGAVAVLGCTGMVLGNGSTLTWLGIGVFLLGLLGFIWVNVRGIG